MSIREWRCTAEAVALTIVAGLAVGCTESTTSTLPEAAAPLQLASTIEGPEMAPEPRFDVGLTVGGTFKPGEPIRINAVVKGLRSTELADLEIRLPEIQLGDLTAWRFDRSPVGISFSPTASQRVALPAGAAASIGTVITAPKPGYYRALLLVTKRSAEPNVDAGRTISTSGRAEVWFIVDEARGGVTGDFDLKRLPQNWLPLIGPARIRGAGAGPASSQLSAGPVASSMRMDSDGTRQLVYYNENTNVYDPIPNVDVIWHIKDSFDGAEIGNGSEVTDSQGVYPAPCSPYANSYVDTEYWYVRGDINITVPFPRWAGAGEGLCGTGPAFAVILDRADVGHVFVTMNRAAAAARAYFGYARAGVPSVQIVGPNGSLGCHTEVSRYGNPGNVCIGSDVIQIMNSGPGIAIFSNWYGDFAQAHEYGHSYHAKALGGNASADQCGGAHDFTQITVNRRCAFSEGFANYFAAATMGPGTNGINQWYTSVQNTPNFNADTSTNGLRWEQAVAGYFLDLTDASGDESWDQVQLAGLTIANVFRDCRVADGGGSSRQVQGADDVAYCIDRQIDTSLQGLMFARGGANVQSITALPTLPSGWSETVRSAAQQVARRMLAKAQ
jgi:hypothetical protein